MSVDLTQFDNQWSSAETADADSLDRLPDGTYQTVVEQIEATQTKGGRPCILWTLRVTGPRYARRLIWHRDYLDKKGQPSLRKQALTTVILRLPSQGVIVFLQTGWAAGYLIGM